jgi:MFS transporter, AAHS family, 4-hydroxybenzoate transporter
LNERRVDLAAVIDGSPFVGVPLLVTVLSFLIMAIDGYDLQSTAFIAPALAAQWHIRPELLGPVLAASIVGMAFGSIGFGWLGDRIGRRISLAMCIALLCLGSLASAYSTDLRQLMIFRVIAGLGLGGATPLVTSLIAEWTPLRWRSVAVAFVIVGVPLGGTIGAALASRIIPVYGWQSVFLVGAALPLMLLALVLLMLPESPKYLAGRPNQKHRLAITLNLLVKQQRYTGSEVFLTDEGSLEKSGRLILLLRTPYLTRTLLIWCAFVCNSLALYSFVNWLPTVLSSSGMSVQGALDGSLLFNFGGMIGALGGSALITRYGSRVVGSSIALAGAIASVLVGVSVVTGGLAAGAHVQLLVFVAVAGVALNGMQIFLYSVSAHSYPTGIRASGIGCASAVARAGGILSSVVGSAVFTLGLSPAQFFYVIGAVIALTTFTFYALPAHIPPRTKRGSNRDSHRGTE